jgi:VIT1/CCC1 family predicted Fe2+/Mn2+ transporter
LNPNNTIAFREFLSMLLRGHLQNKKETNMNRALNQLTENAPDKQVAMKAMKSLSAQDQTDIANQLGFQPSRQVTDMVWKVIVISFALVLVGGFVALAMAVFAYGKLSGDLLLTVFTTAAAFLAGLLAPSPTQAKPPQQ